MFRVCSECVQSVFRVCSECVKSVLRKCSGYVQSMFGVVSGLVVKIGCPDRLSRLVVKIVVIASFSASSVKFLSFF